MYEYNELTKELLKQGYDAKHFPDYVKIPSGNFGSGNPLENIYGGFEYKMFHSDEFVYKTGCGMFVKGIEVLGDMSCNGKFHSHENNNPVIRCPFMKTETCEETFYCVNEWCECHRTEEPYSSDFCLTKEREKKAEHIKEVYRQFSESRNGRVCENHMRYVEKTDSIEFSYTPSHCAVACFHPDFCPILNKPLDTKKGNVFYDVKKIYPGKKQEGENISLFDKEEYISIEKGKRVFNKPVSMDICNAYVKVQSHEIAEMWKLNHSTEWLFNEGFRFEILNIRAEKKETRDIWQDIQDIKEGATIIHESDKIQQKKDEKRQRKEDAKEKLKRKIIKKVESGEALSMADQRHIGKLFEPGEFQKIKKCCKAETEGSRRGTINIVLGADMKIYMIGNKEEENCYQNFQRYEQELTEKGHIVINPLKVIAGLPIGINSADYVVISTGLIRICDAVFYVPGYEKSLIANLEKGNAIRQEKTIYE